MSFDDNLGNLTSKPVGQQNINVLGNKLLQIDPSGRRNLAAVRVKEYASGETDCACLRIDFQSQIRILKSFDKFLDNL
ncbi:hypothetical protein D3C75_1165150 [compost metagenome]